MKSYYKYLESSQTPASGTATLRKPVFRSSSIFPVVQGLHGIQTRICFMGYWILKREIREITVLCTLRGAKGAVLKRESILVDSAKAFSLELEQLLEGAGEDLPFTGSVELEVFSTRDLVFPYPAFVVVYYNERFSTAVHTAGRIYNDVEDLQENSESSVPESGFDVYAEEGLDPFIAFTNGPFVEQNPEIRYELVNHEARSLEGVFQLPRLEPHETCFLFLKDHIDFSTHLGGRPGAVKIRHAFKGFFPRFIAGNLQPAEERMSVTHTYYDCTERTADSDYWKETDDSLHDGAIFVPLFTDGELYTDVVFYPIYSPARFSVALEFYDDDGRPLKKLDDFLRIDTGRPVFERLALKEIAARHGINAGRARGVNLVKNALPGSRFPTRIKMGLNVGRSRDARHLPCNICFNSRVGDASLLKKPRSFHWAPFLNIGDSVLVVTNASFEKEYGRPADIELSFFRSQDARTLKRSLRLAPFAQRRLDVRRDPELSAFFGDRTGWAVFESTNPFVYGWYFDLHASAAVAGDHCF